MSRKGETGPNQGKKAATAEAVLGCYQFQGVWKASGIVPEPCDWGGQIFVKVKRISA